MSSSPAAAVAAMIVALPFTWAMSWLALPP